MAKFHRKKPKPMHPKKKKSRRGNSAVAVESSLDVPFKSKGNTGNQKQCSKNPRDIKRLQKKKQIGCVIQRGKLSSDVLLNAEKRDLQFFLKNGKRQESDTKFSANHVFKSYYKEFKKVIDAADIVIEVLDARDPLGSRCPEVEQSVIHSGPGKRLILLLNKIDLIPRENLVQWLKYLRQEFPTVAFKACTQSQNNNLSRSHVAAIHINKNLQASRRCVGANFLMKVLGNYCRNQDIRTSIRVGIVGFPNVGKSSIINSLKRCRTCDVGATPGVTKNMQEIILDKHIRLLDSPGIVFAKEGSGSSLALRNAVKIETLDDVLVPAEAIIQRADRHQLCSHYGVPEYSSVQEFLYLLAKKTGRYKKGGIPDTECAARKLLYDWNCGIIKYFTHPPEVYQPSIHISAELVQEMSKAFDIEALGEQMELEELDCESPPEGKVADAIESININAGTMDLSSNDENYVQQLEEEAYSEDFEGSPLSGLLSAVTTVTLDKKQMKKHDISEMFDGRKHQKNKYMKRIFKNMKKKRKRQEKFINLLSEKCLNLSLS